MKSRCISCVKLSEKKIGVSWNVPVYIFNSKESKVLLEHIVVPLRYKYDGDYTYHMKYFKNIDHVFNKISKKFGIKKNKINLYFPNRTIIKNVPNEIDLYFSIVDDVLYRENKLDSLFL